MPSRKRRGSAPSHSTPVDGPAPNRKYSNCRSPAFVTLERSFTLDWITPEIAIGNCEDALWLEGLRNAGIRSILSLNGWPNSAVNFHGLTWRCVELIDGFGNPVTRLQEAVWQLHALVEQGTVLVHCMEGVSRSPLVVASYLADRAARPFEDCLQEVAQLRRYVSLQPGLMELRRAYESAFEPHQRMPRLAQPGAVLASDSL